MSAILRIKVDNKDEVAITSPDGIQTYVEFLVPVVSFDFPSKLSKIGLKKLVDSLANEMSPKERDDLADKIYDLIYETFVMNWLKSRIVK